MSRRFVRHLRSHAVAYLALVIALGGTSYAAVALPRNSVGANQIRPNAVSSSEVRNGSLRAADFAAGQIGGATVVRLRNKVSVSTGQSTIGVPPQAPLHEQRHVQPAGATEGYLTEISVRVPQDCRYNDGEGHVYPGFAAFSVVVDNQPAVGNPPAVAFSAENAGKLVTLQLGQSNFFFEAPQNRQRVLSLRGGDNCNETNTDFTVEAIAINVLRFR